MKLILPTTVLRRIMHALRADGRPGGWVTVGLSRNRVARSWLVRDLGLGPCQAPPDVLSRTMRIAITEEWGPTAHWGRGSGPLLHIGDRLARGRAWYDSTTPFQGQNIRQLYLAGPGMERMAVDSAPPPTADATPPVSGRRPPAASGGRRDEERWSRTIGAVGGVAAWRRFRRLRFAVVGCGRTGSLVVHSLVRLGARKVALIDPDVVELHNVGEMDLVTPSDVSLPKVQVLAHHLECSVKDLNWSSGLHLRPVVEYVRSPAAMEVLKGSDVIASCVDHDAARFVATFVATAFYKVHLDVGTAVHALEDAEYRGAEGRGQRTMGGDVRLLVPGERCLLCFGGLSDLGQAVRRVLGPADQRTPEPTWTQTRAGSSRPLNQLAAHVGVQMLLDMVAGELPESSWCRIEYDERGQLSVEYPPPGERRSGCELCAVAGLGDEAMKR